MTQSNIQLIVVTHGDLACSLVRTVEMIAGKQYGILCFALFPGADMQAFMDNISAAANTDRPTLVLVDMQGGSPWNVAVAIAARNELVSVVSGVNLPMLLEIIVGQSEQDAGRIGILAVEAGRHGIEVTGAGKIV
jgi:mannose PTS system EIIA component